MEKDIQSQQYVDRVTGLLQKVGRALKQFLREGTGPCFLEPRGEQPQTFRNEKESCCRSPPACLCVSTK